MREMTPEELKQATISEAELLKNGADYSGKLEPRVPQVTSEQKETAKKEMEIELFAKDLLKNFTPDEIKILVDGLLSYGRTKFAENVAGEDAKRTTDSLLERFNGVEQAAKEIEKIKLAELAQQTLEKQEAELVQQMR